MRVHRFRYLLVVVATLVALVSAELICRLFIPPRTSLRFQQDVDELEGAQLHAASTIIENDPELFWRLVPNKRLPAGDWPFFGIVSNGQSLREDQEIPLKKPNGQVRILFLGDSCTFGYGVKQDKTFVAIAESLIRDKYGRPAECINAGVPGYTLFQGYQYLRMEGMRYQPDLVVLNFGWNDYRRWDGLSDLEHYSLWQAAKPPGPLQHSHLCQLIWSRAGTRPPPEAQAETRPRLLPGEFAETLEEIGTLLQDQQIPFLILVWPMRDNTKPGTPPALRSELQMEMISFGQVHPVSTSPKVSGVLDLVPLGRDLVREHGSVAIYFDEGHATALGHEAIGTAIADHIAPWLSAQ